MLTDKKLSQKDKTLMSSKDENENENESENDKTLISSKDDDDNETLNQNNNDIIKKSFQDQIRSIRKLENPNEYYFIDEYSDKEFEFKIFKLKLAHLLNIIDEKIFKQIFVHTFETLQNKLINTANKEENQITVNNINESKEKLYEEKEDEMRAFYDYVIQPSDQRNNLIEAINLILDFNKIIQLDLI